MYIVRRVFRSVSRNGVKRFFHDLILHNFDQESRNTVKVYLQVLSRSQSQMPRALEDANAAQASSMPKLQKKTDYESHWNCQIPLL